MLDIPRPDGWNTSPRARCEERCDGRCRERCSEGAPRIESAPSTYAREARVLLDVLVDELRHLEHRYLLLAAENPSELLIGVDVATDFRILQAVPLDVLPELLRDLG